MTTDAPRRFTPDQVLVAFTAAGTSAAPLTTTDIAKAVRRTHGLPELRDDVAGNSDVTRALGDLVADGRLVTSKNPGWRKNWQDDDERHAHLLPPGNGVDRFYATPEQSAAWKARLDDAARKNDHLSGLGERLSAVFDGGGVPLDVGARAMHTRYAGTPSLGLILTAEQVQYLLGEVGA